MEQQSLEKRISEVLLSEDKYIVPLYQREFAWTEDEIQQLIEDIYENYTINPNGSYFIGSLVLIKRQDKLYEVIDGQQRLTILSILAKYIEPETYKECHLTYDSREEVCEFLKQYYSNFDKKLSVNEFFEKYLPLLCENHLLDNFKNALDTIENCVIQKESSNIETESISLKTLEEDKGFVDYFFNHVVIIRNEMPQDTNVADYFEIMNNSGEQLQKHEILKSLLMAKIANDDRSMIVFSRIWDACAFMDDHVERFFSAEERKVLFGDFVNEFHPDNLMEIYDFNNPNIDIEGDDYIKDILSNPKYIKAIEEGDEEDKEFRSEAIIDFPNFLMHVFRLEYDDIYRDKNKNSDSSVPLNEKDLIKVYKKIQADIDPMDFVKNLLYYRVIFDRYIVRLADDDTDKDGKWTLKRPQRYEWKKKVSVSYEKNTFDDRNNDFVVKAESMLQVSFPQKKYKNYLFTILSWFKGSNEIELDYSIFFDKLNRYILSLFDEYEKQYKSPGQDLYSLGCNTPRFVLNFIDYLYYLEEQRSFSFKYLNSVEHHLPQNSLNYSNIGRDVIDSIGNLYLIGKGENSSLRDNDPISKTKKVLAKATNIAPKRSKMYELTIKKVPVDWNADKIREHCNDVKRLIDKREELVKTQTINLCDPYVWRALFCIKDYRKLYKGDKYYIRPDIPECSTDNDRLDDAKKILKEWLLNNKDKSVLDFIYEQFDSPNSDINKPINWYRKAMVLSDSVWSVLAQDDYSGLVSFPDDGEIYIMHNRDRRGKLDYMLSVLSLEDELWNKEYGFSFGYSSIDLLLNEERQQHMDMENDYANSPYQIWLVYDKDSENWRFVFCSKYKSNNKRLDFIKELGFHAIPNPNIDYCEGMSSFFVPDEDEYFDVSDYGWGDKTNKTSEWASKLVDRIIGCDE